MSNIALLGIQGYLPAQDLGFKGAYGLQRWKEPGVICAQPQSCQGMATFTHFRGPTQARVVVTTPMADAKAKSLEV